MTREECRKCKHLGDIYFPPKQHQAGIHLKGCFYFADGHDGIKQVMYLDSLDGCCEVFEEGVKND